MKGLYVISHGYEVDGGFGDAIYTEMPIGIVETEEKAKAYCEKWNNEHVYDTPYADLSCGRLTYEKFPFMEDMDAPPYKYLDWCEWAFNKESEEYREVKEEEE